MRHVIFLFFAQENVRDEQMAIPKSLKGDYQTRNGLGYMVDDDADDVYQCGQRILLMAK